MQPCLVHDVAAQEVQQQQQQRGLASKAQDMIPTAVAEAAAAAATFSCRSTLGQSDTDTAVCNPLATHSSLNLSINFSDYDLDLDHLVPDPTLDLDQTLDTWQDRTDLDRCDGLDDTAGIEDFCQTNEHETPLGHSNSRGSVQSVHVQRINKATAAATPCVESNDVWWAAKEGSVHMAAVQEQQAVQQQQQQQQQQPDKLSGPSSVMNLQPQPQPPSLTMQAQQTAAAAAAGSSTTTTFLVPAGGRVRLSDLLTPDICANAHLALQQRLNAAYQAGYVEGVEYCQQQVKRQQQRALTAAKSKQQQKQKGLKRKSCDNLPDACFKAAKKKIVHCAAPPAASSPTQAAAAAAAAWVSKPERSAKDVIPVAAAGGGNGSVGDDEQQLTTAPSMASFLTVDKQEAAARLRGLTDSELLMLAAQVVKQSAQVP